MFLPGERIAGRYDVVRFLAGGGAGEVYEVEDRELGGRVALKALRQTVSGDPRRFERFRREIHLARRVTHPNVCRIYDAGHHERRRAPGPATGADPTPHVASEDQVFFLTMELLAGETLATRLAADGRLGPAEALPIARQIADGLDAAHAAGVVHRDLKSANVMLVPAPERPPGVRAVVTDFGLARAGEQGEGSSGVTLTGTILGTPSYMAPEQVEGGEITAAADVYAFGVILFEMTTGTLPFGGDSPLSIAVARLQMEPPSPRRLRPDLDARWERVIRRAMARRPEDRFPSAGAAVAALSTEATDLLHGPGDHRRGFGSGLRVAAAIAVAAVALAGALLWRAARMPATAAASSAAGAAVAPSPAASTAPPARARARQSVAVLGFKNLSGAPVDNWLSTAFAEMLSTEIAAGENVRTVPGEIVARVRQELALPPVDSLAGDTLQRLRRGLGSDFVLLGSYVAPPGTPVLRLDLVLQDTASGEVLHESAEGTRADLFALVGRAGAALRARLGVAALAARDETAVRAAQPANADAARFYAEGLSRLRLFDAIGARESLEQAVSADPGFPLALTALADAWSRLGYDARAQDAAERAARSAADLPREERLWIGARAKETAKDAAGAAAAYRELVALFPDDPEYRLRLANALIDSSDSRGALALLPSGKDAADPRFALVEATAYWHLSDYPRQLAAARRAHDAGSASGATLLVARARHLEGLALASLGQPAAAMDAYRESRATYQNAGDRYSAAQEQRAIATLLRAQGRLHDAELAANEALKICRTIGAQAEAARDLNTLSNVYYQQGDIVRAARGYAETLAVFREIGDRHSEAAVLGNLANTRHLLGDLAGAIAAHRQALTLKREEGNRNGIATSLVGLASAEAARGDLRPAGEALTEALDISRASGEKSLLASTAFAAGDLALARGDLAGARALHTEARDLRRVLGEQGGVAESTVALARVDLEEHGAAAATPALRAGLAQAIDELHGEGASDSEADARTVHARALRLAGENAAARAEIARAGELAQRSDDRSYRIAADLERARLDAATGQRPAALERLRAARADALARGLKTFELEARLALGELDPASDLEALARDAEALGYGLVAAKARAARTVGPRRAS